MIIREGVALGARGKPEARRTARVSMFVSLWEFFEKTKKALGLVEDSSDSYDRCQDLTNALPEVKAIITNGWSRVIDALKVEEKLSRDAFAPKRVFPYSYEGNRVSIDRFILGKQCIAKPKMVNRKHPQFVRIFFLGEAMASAGDQEFITKCAELMNYIRTAESLGQRVELWLGFGATGVYYNRPGHACLCLIKVKEFSDSINLLSLSSVGHPSLLRTIQFGWEFSQSCVKTPDFDPGPSRIGPRSVLNIEAYSRALDCFLPEESVDSITWVVRKDCIDPKGWLSKDGF